MLERLFTGDLDRPPEPGENGRGDMRAYFLEKFRTLAAAADADVTLVESEGTLDATVRMSVPDEALSRMRDAFNACLTAGEIEDIIDVIEAYGREAVAETARITSRAETTLEEDMAEQCVVTASVWISQAIRELLCEAMESRFAEARNEHGTLTWDGAVENDAERDGETIQPYDDPDANERQPWHDDPDAWNPDAPHPDEDYEDLLGEEWSRDGEEEELIEELAAARQRDGDAGDRVREEIVVDERIVDAAMSRTANVAIIREGLREIAKFLDSEALDRRFSALELIELQGWAECSPETLMELRAHGELAGFLDRLDENDAAECFESLFEDIAQEALLAVPGFTAMYEAVGEEDDDRYDGERDKTMDAYVDALRRRCHGG